MMIKRLMLMLIVILLMSCKEENTKVIKNQETTSVNVSKNKKAKIYLQPYKDFGKRDVELIKNYLASELEHYSIEILPAIDMPKKNKSAHRDRFRADSIIRDMRAIAHKENARAVLALTTKDISTTYKGNADWGVMGLGFRLGKGAVISTFRLNKKNKSEQMLKLATHELGHNLGLDHCLNKTCIMRDAKGKNVIDDKKGFCNECKSFLNIK